MALTHSKEEVFKLCEELETPQVKFYTEDVGHVWFLPNTNNDRPVAIVWIADQQDIVKEYSTLVHEAIHIVIYWTNWMREASPSDEFIAYGISNIAENLMQAHYEWRRTNGFK